MIAQVEKQTTRAQMTTQRDKFRHGTCSKVGCTLQQLSGIR